MSNLCLFGSSFPSVLTFNIFYILHQFMLSSLYWLTHSLNLLPLHLIAFTFHCYPKFSTSSVKGLSFSHALPFHQQKSVPLFLRNPADRWECSHNLVDSVIEIYVIEQMSSWCFKYASTKLYCIIYLSSIHLLESEYYLTNMNPFN